MNINYLRSLIFLTLTALLVSSCKSESTWKLSDLTNNTCKYWRLTNIVRLKDNSKEYKDFQVLKFCKNGTFLEYEFDGKRLNQRSYTCWVPQHKWKLKEPKQLNLNGRIFYIIDLKPNHMELYSKELNLKLFYRQTHLRPKDK